MVFLSAVWTLILTAPIHIHWWASDGMLHFSKFDEETNSSTSWTAWGWIHVQHTLIFIGLNYSFKRLVKPRCKLVTDTYYKFWVRRQFLANKSSISTHIKLQETRKKQFLLKLKCATPVTNVFWSKWFCYATNDIFKKTSPLTISDFLSNLRLKELIKLPDFL